MLDKVKGIEWRFLDNAGNWHTDWPTASAAASTTPPNLTLSELPRAVEVTLDLDDLGQLTRLFSVPGERPAAAARADSRAHNRQTEHSLPAARMRYHNHTMTRRLPTQLARASL